MLTSAASWKPWVPISTDSHLFRRFLKGRYFLEYWPFPYLFRICFPLLCCSVPIFLYLLSCLVVLFGDADLGGWFSWCGLLGWGYRELACGCVLGDDCRGLHEHVVARTILVVVVSGGLCAVWSFDSESGLLMIVGEWPFPGFAGHVGPGDGEARRA